MADISGKYGALSKEGIWESCDSPPLSQDQHVLSLFIHLMCYKMIYYFVKSFVTAYLLTCLHYCIMAQYFSMFNCLFLIIFNCMIYWQDMEFLLWKTLNMVNFCLNMLENCQRLSKTFCKLSSKSIAYWWKTTSSAICCKAYTIWYRAALWLWWWQTALEKGTCDISVVSM